ncbi:MAG TPA: hypothetical protein VLI41_13440 [Phenylobacterium sp.]|uniref:hypothetical protein n=1 Tax=Phenylobacterium sp. TaxID=1871053 RepID=UPI002BC7D31F|nr:hypothetical protein [Phenylobacterium sp.]HSV04197.1 hypothetical protein [Phenylobacterium sp.]
MLRTSLILFAAALALGACAKRTTPPGTAGVCYHVVFEKNGRLKYNRLVNAPNLETCAANLEAMRLKFLGMGGSATELLGAYQSNFIFVEREGIFTSTSLEGPRYVALVRTGDGRLAIPGAMPQQ